LQNDDVQLICQPHLWPDKLEIAQNILNLILSANMFYVHEYKKELDKKENEYNLILNENNENNIKENIQETQTQ
jgi:hypothetical protein